MSFELNKTLAAKRAPLNTSAKIDPVTAGIIRGAFETVCFEAATHLGRAASSPIINQSNERNGSVHRRARPPGRRAPSARRTSCSFRS